MVTHRPGRKRQNTTSADGTIPIANSSAPDHGHGHGHHDSTGHGGFDGGHSGGDGGGGHF